MPVTVISAGFDVSIFSVSHVGITFNGCSFSSPAFTVVSTNAGNATFSAFTSAFTFSSSATEV